MKDFEMTQEQLNVLMDASKSVPLIALNCGSGVSQQQRANLAWERLGDELGFEYMTVQPTGKGNRFFKAKEKPAECQGIEIGDGNFSGCDQSQGDCPSCGK
jgi:hypothetical protein